MLYLTCTTITSVDLARYGVSRAKDWVSVDCGTKHQSWSFRLFEQILLVYQQPCFSASAAISKASRRTGYRSSCPYVLSNLRLFHVTGFYSDVAECSPITQETWVQIRAGGHEKIV